MAAGNPPLDPRTDASPEGEADVRPVVAVRRAGPPTIVLIGAALAAALFLFLVLDARRRSPPAPAVVARGVDLPGSTPAPPLYVPPEPPPQVVVREPVAAAPAPVPAPQPQPAIAPQVIYVPQPAQPAPSAPPPPARATPEPALVIDTTAGPAGATAAAATAAAGGGESLEAASGTAVLGTRSRAGVLANRATTVPQGTLIPAVMETAFNSARPGFARAIVSRDVRGFDGSRVLIPRGSRLIGEYRSDATQGQKRALINWVRLIRPDGVTIAIASPATDPMGGSGIRAKVNSHFFERFAGAILRSTVDVGMALASRAGSSSVVVLPGTVQGTASVLPEPTEIRPTLTVPPATSISVFVARDLDFTGVEGRR